MGCFLVDLRVFGMVLGQIWREMVSFKNCVIGHFASLVTLRRRRPYTGHA